MGIFIVFAFLAGFAGGHSDAVHKAAKDPAYAQRVLDKHVAVNPVEHPAPGYDGGE